MRQRRLEPLASRVGCAWRQRAIEQIALASALLTFGMRQAIGHGAEAVNKGRPAHTIGAEHDRRWRTHRAAIDAAAGDMVARRRPYRCKPDRRRDARETAPDGAHTSHARVHRRGAHGTGAHGAVR